MSCHSYIATLFAPVLLLMLPCITYGQDAQKIKVLLIDGQHDHPWQQTSPAIAQSLRRSGRFEVERSTTPPKGEDLTNFRPRFSANNVVVLNYSGQTWSESTCRELVDYVARGGGLVVFHSANSSFPKWKEYNEMIGLGGGNGRDEKDGPYLRLQEGEWKADTSPGKAGGEHPAAPFLVETFAADHPVMKGLPDKWLHAEDELVFNLRGPAKNLHVLAMSFSPDEGGIDQYTPVIFTVDYGKGRVFHTTMGNDLGSVMCMGFVTIFRRGVEWAATGNVSIPVPNNFPTADEVQTWKPAVKP